MDYLQISNLPIIWFLCSFTVIIAALQAVLSLVRLILLRNSRSRD